MSDLEHVKGLSGVENALGQLVVRLQKGVARQSLRVGAEVIRDTARKLAPAGPPSSENARIYGGFYGALRATIRMSGTKTKGSRVSATVTAGGKFAGAEVYYAHFLEWGTRPHKITARAHKWLSFGGLFAKEVDHPGIVNPHPFMQPARDAAHRPAVIATGNEMKRLLAEKGVDTSGIGIGGDT